MLAKLSKNAGAKIVIHDPALPAIPDEYGIDMQPNTARDQCNAMKLFTSVIYEFL